jgi:hypothetical protein
LLTGPAADDLPSVVAVLLQFKIAVVRSFELPLQFVFSRRHKVLIVIHLRNIYRRAGRVGGSAPYPRMEALPSGPQCNGLGVGRLILPAKYNNNNNDKINAMADALAYVVHSF